MPVKKQKKPQVKRSVPPVQPSRVAPPPPSKAKVAANPPRAPAVTNVAKMFNMLASYAAVVTPKAGIEGIEVDPHQNITYKTTKYVDSRSYKVDAKRCVREHEITNDALDAMSVPSVFRQFWTAPGPRLSEESPDTYQYDSRGNMTKLHSFKISVKNLSDAPVRFVATSARALNDEVDTIHLRASLANSHTWLAPNQTKTFKSRAGANSNFYWTQDAKTGQYQYHVFDGYVVIPDSPPQDQSSISTELINPADSEIPPYPVQTRIWNNDAEVVEITVKAEYTAQDSSHSDIFTEEGAFKLTFSRDLTIPLKVSTAVKYVNGRTLPNTATVQDQPYDLSLEGWSGLGVALLYVESEDYSIPYLAKYDKQEPIKRVSKDGKKDKILKKKMRSDDFPAFRIKALESPDITVMFNGGFSYGSDATGYDQHTLTGNFKWSPTYDAFVAWDFSRNDVLRFLEDWDYPNYYSPWIANYPPAGVIQFQRVPSKNIPTVGLVDPDVLVDSSIAWELILSVATTVLTAAINIGKAIAAHNSAESNTKAPK